MIAAKKFLATVSAAEPVTADFDEVRIEVVVVPPGSPLAGHRLAELAPTRRCGVQLIGIGRNGGRILNPGAEETLREGDEVLVLGNTEQIDAFKTMLFDLPGSAGEVPSA
jgi:K+/H+ antiporter YhaU regulatory subunit KhtT